jgi:hypothetical protein
MKKRMVILAVAGILTLSSLTGCGKIKDTDVVATVGDTEITADVANFYARYTQAQYESYYSAYFGDNMWETEVEEGQTYEEYVKDSLLESLETMVLLEAHMDDYDVELSDDETQAIKDAAAEFVEANEEDTRDKVSGTQEAAERVLTLLTIQQKMTTAIEADADTEVSDDEAAQKSMEYVEYTYTTTDDDGNSVDMTDEEKEEVKEQAEAFAKGAKDADDFDAYAEDQGVTASTLTFDSETTSPSEDLIAVADELDEGEVSDVVETDDGCYVAKLTSLFDQDATDSKKETIISERKSELYESTCEEWKDAVDITVNKKVWKKISFTDLTVTIKETETEDETSDTDDGDLTVETSDGVNVETEDGEVVSGSDETSEDVTDETTDETTDESSEDTSEDGDTAADENAGDAEVNE